MEILKEGLAESMAMIPLALLVSAMLLREIPKVRQWHIILVMWFLGITAGIIFEDKTEFLGALVRGFVTGTLATGLAIFYGKFLVKQE